MIEFSILPAAEIVAERAVGGEAGIDMIGIVGTLISAAVMARNAIGSNAAELRDVGAQMRRMLKENGPPPGGRWKDLEVLEPVRDYKPRHASTLLVFDAVENAIAEIEERQTNKAQ